MPARCACFLAPVLAALSLSAPAALGQSAVPPATPGKGSQQEFLQKFEREHKKKLADGNYDVVQLNNESGGFIYRCTALRIKSAYAIELCEQSLARDKARNAFGDLDSHYTVGALAKLYQAAGKHDRALAVLEEFVQWHKNEYGEKNRLTLGVTRQLADALLEAKRYDRAVKLYQSLLANQQPGSPEKVNLLGEVMRVYEKAGNWQQELATGETILEQMQPRKKNDFFNPVSNMRVHLARRCIAVGKKELVLRMIEGDLQRSRQNKGVDNLETIALLPEVAQRYFALEQPKKALSLLTEAVELRKKKQGADHADTLLAQNTLAQGYHQVGNLDEAIKTYAAVLPKMKEKFGASDQQTLAALKNLCYGYESSNRLADAEPLWRENVEIQRKAPGPLASSQVALALALLGTNLLKQEKWTDAEKVLRECLDLRRKKEAQLWSTYNAASLVGAALMGQKKYKEAEPLLLEGYQGMKQRQPFMPPQARIRVTEALQRLVKLYDETDRTDKADEYRKLLPPEKKP